METGVAAGLGGRGGGAEAGGYRVATPNSRYVVSLSSSMAVSRCLCVVSGNWGNGGVQQKGEKGKGDRKKDGKETYAVGEGVKREGMGRSVQCIVRLVGFIPPKASCRNKSS